MSKVIHAFTAVSMINGHDGLTSYARSKGVVIDTLPSGSLVVFYSRDRMRIKILSPNGVMGYLRAKNNLPFTLEALQFFPQAFTEGGSVNYDKALKLQLESLFVKKGRYLDPLSIGAMKRAKLKLPQVVRAIKR